MIGSASRATVLVRGVVSSVVAEVLVGAPARRAFKSRCDLRGTFYKEQQKGKSTISDMSAENDL